MPPLKKESDRLRTVVLTGYVWCEKNGEIHNDTLDPHDYGPPEDAEQAKDLGWWCEPEDHRPVFIKARPSEGSY